MRLEDYFKELIEKNKKRFNKNSEHFEIDYFNFNYSLGRIGNEREEMKDEVFPEMIQIPINLKRGENVVERKLNKKYFQLENGLFVSPRIFKYLGYLETNQKKDSFLIID